MEIWFLLLIVVHGFFHLLGFMLAYNLLAIKNTAIQIRHIDGLILIVAFILYAFLILMYVYKSTNWWIYGIAGTIISQLVFFKYWKLTKYGTIPNLIILIICLIAISEHFLLGQK